MAEQMAIAHDWLLRHRGGERVLKEFCHRFKDLSIYTLFLDPEAVHPVIRQHAIYVSRLGRLPGVTRYYRYLLPWFRRGIEHFHIRKVDLLLSISHAVAKGIPHEPDIPHVCYCLTPMRYLWEERKLYFPNGRPDFKEKLLERFSRKLRQWDLESNRSVDFFVAISQTVKERIKRTYGREAEVIYPCVDLELFHPVNGTRKRGTFYLIVSSLVPYKRIDLAIEAFNRCGKPLLIAGDGPIRRQLAREAKSNIRFLGRVTDQELCRLYNTAQGLIFPGVEDFGLVPLEAQACGCPVIAYGEGGATETVTDGETGLFFRDSTVEALLGAIELFDKARFDESRAVENACRFSSDRFWFEWKHFFQKNGLRVNFLD